MKIRFNYNFIVFILFLACTKEEVTPRVYPRVITIEAFDITSGGVTFKGEITYTNVEVVDHGFVWSDATGPLLNTANKLSLGPASGPGVFEMRAERSLEQGKKYFLRAYAVSDDYTVYGTTLEFVSLGGKAPVVKEFYPALGTWSDTVTVVGENFSDENRINEVKFGSALANVFKSTKDTLLVRVPGDLTSELSTVKVSVAGNSSQIQKQFQLIGPEIASVTPDFGLPGTKVVIKGKYLLSYATEVFFGGVKATPTNWSSTQIDCLVPNMPNGTVSLSVRTGTGNLAASTFFKVQPEHLPELHDVQPAIAKFGETIKLIGDFFATDPGKLTVKFGNADASIVAQSKTEIEVVVPWADSRTPIIKVTSEGSSVSINTFSFKSPVVTDFSPHRGGPGNELVITGSDFNNSYLKVFLDDEQLYIENVEDDKIHTRIPYKTQHEATVKVVFYDQEFVLSEKFTSPWALLDAFPGYNLENAEVMTYNNTAYFVNVGLGPQGNNQVWRFNGNQWTQLNNFPGTARERLFSFVLGSKGYIGGGALHTMEKIREQWEYDISTDSWTQQADIPLQYDTPFGFAVGSEGYAYDRYEQADMLPSKLWKYNGTADTWSEKSVAPTDVSGIMVSFVIGNSVYLFDRAGLQYFWKYTPSTNQWVNLGSPPAIFDVAFTMGGFGYATNGAGLYKYNHTNNTWTQEATPTIHSQPVAGFSINGKAYIISAYPYSSYYDYVYEYDPNF